MATFQRRIHVLPVSVFQTRFGTESACLAYLKRARWPEGFACPACGQGCYSFIQTRRLFQCCACRRQTSLTAGTIFHGSRVPLTKWFWAIYLLAQDKKGCSALWLSKQLDVCYPTAWLMSHKIRQAMAGAAFPAVLHGVIELDDAYLGGARPAEPGKQGRAAPGKTPILVAVEARSPTAVGRAALAAVRNFRKPTVRRFVQRHLAAGCQVKTDWMGGFAQLPSLGYQHDRQVQGRGTAAQGKLPLVHRIISNLKRFLLGRHHAIEGKHAPRYLGEFAFRLNHRHQEATLFERLLPICATSQVITYPALCRAEPR
jgi:hypothetical protein